uniref:Uncharacterized protein n=1 Tax=Strombidium inclinatum TaxID=197538 RepID=A0A7S3ITN3_9SPIT|mmetsp:Transcript_35595/g.54420  ORF Transcript_35595/g.54420 Transcript_35595/m.54420 type:complete len:153 (+) Transcript_35595:318-776(+)
MLDTLIILLKLKVVLKGDKKWLEWATYWFGFLWTVANFFSWFGSIYELVKIQSEELKLLLKKKVLHSQGNTEKGQKNASQLEELNKQQAELVKRRFDQSLIFSKSVGDCLVSAQMIGMPRAVISADFNDGMMGFGGFVSGCISCYQLYPAKK